MEGGRTGGREGGREGERKEGRDVRKEGERLGTGNFLTDSAVVGGISPPPGLGGSRNDRGQYP